MLDTPAPGWVCFGTCVCPHRSGVCVYYCSTCYKAVRERGGGDGGHVLRETTSRGRCELVCPSRTNERGGEGYCVKEGEGVCVLLLQDRVCFMTAGPITKLCAWGEEESGGHVL